MQVILSEQEWTELKQRAEAGDAAVDKKVAEIKTNLRNQLADAADRIMSSRGLYSPHDFVQMVRKILS